MKGSLATQAGFELMDERDSLQAELDIVRECVKELRADKKLLAGALKDLVSASATKRIHDDLEMWDRAEEALKTVGMEFGEKTSKADSTSNFSPFLIVFVTRILQITDPFTQARCLRLCQSIWSATDGQIIHNLSRDLFRGWAEEEMM